MIPSDLEKAVNLVKKHERYKQFIYPDIKGNLTIGFGHNLQANGMSFNIASLTCEEDVTFFVTKLDSLLHFYKYLSVPRKAVLIDLCFNCGVNGLLQFKKMLTALEKNDYDTAANEIINSKIAHERAVEDAYIMRSNEL